MKPRTLRLVVMHVSGRCDQACAHCSVWERGTRTSELGVAPRLALIREARHLGAQSILFTGGEPLLCDHLEALAREARTLGISVQIASNGLSLSRSPWISGVVDEVFVSLEGPEEIHDSVRGARMFSRLRASLTAVRASSVRPRLIARSVLSRLNAGAIESTVAAARELGFDAVSFLGVDVTSEAFGGRPQARTGMLPDDRDVAALEAGIGRLAARGETGAFILEDERKLREIAGSFRSGSGVRAAPRCNAPEWSSVIEADGAIRPCFFQSTVSRRSGATLGDVRNSREYATALVALGPGNAVCEKCVCPKYQPGLLSSFASGLAARVAGRRSPGTRVPAASVA